jgi:hypothetical protein
LLDHYYYIDTFSPLEEDAAMQYVSTLIILESEGDHQARVWDYLQESLAGLQLSPQHPDVHWYNWGPFAEDETPSLKIETVRELTADMGFGGYKSENRLFLVNRVDTASLPAQNALLKTVEEPPTGVHLILTALDLDAVLPTIQSRCQVVRLTQAAVQTDLAPAAEWYQQFINVPAGQTIALVDEWGSDRAAALERLGALTRYLSQRLTHQPTPQLLSQLSKLNTAITQLKKNANVKLALDQCFLGF